jgi:hypothetical protein
MKDDLKTAMDELVDPNLGTRIGNSLGDVVNTIGGIFGVHLTTPIEAYKAELASVSDTLAQMVNDGHAKEAADTFERLKQAFIARGAGTGEDFVKLFGSYQNAIDGVANAAGDATPKVATLDETLAKLAGTAGTADDATVALGDAMRSALEPINASGSAVNKAHTALNLYSAAGAEAEGKLRAVADAALGGVDAWVKNGDSAAVVRDRVQKARDAFIASATAAGLSATAAGKLATKYGLIPSRVYTSIIANTKPATAAVNTFLAKINKRTAIITVGAQVYARLASGKLVPLADGGPVKGPGGPRDDRIPAMLSNGEFVVNAAAAAKNKHLLEVINSMKSPIMLANGGAVGTDARRRIAMGRGASPLVPGSHGSATPVVNNVDNRKTYNVAVTETRGPSTADSITARLRSLEVIGA